MLTGAFAVLPNLWVFQSRFFHTNSGVFVSAGQATLIDPAMQPEEIDRIARHLAEVGAIAQWMVLTHHHWDHILGPERLPGIPVVAHAGFAAAASLGAGEIRRAIGQWEAKLGVNRAQPFAIPQPEVTFDDDLRLPVGELELRLLHVPGHAPDQLALYEPAAACLWASDILSDLEIPYVSDSLARYERTLERLTGYELRVLVPGHGHPTTDPAEIRARLDRDRAYLAELRQRVTRAVQAGQPVAAAVEAAAGMTYRYPELNRGSHRLNVESVYLELGGEADPGRVGWAQNWTAAEAAAADGDQA